jgi:hypothetical protein
MWYWTLVLQPELPYRDPNSSQEINLKTSELGITSSITMNWSNQGQRPVNASHFVQVFRRDQEATQFGRRL